MAITDAQQAKQIMMKKGGIPQLVKKGKGKKRPGYRGDDAARSSEGTSGGRADPGGSSRGDGPARGGGGGGNTNRERGITQQYKGPKGTTGSIKNVRDDGPKEYIGGQEFNVNPTTPQEQERKNFAISIAADKKRVADRKKAKKDLTFIENYLGPKGYINRNLSSNLKSLGVIDKKFDTIGGVPIGFTGAIAEAFDVPESVKSFDIDSPREIAAQLSKSKTGITKSQAKDIGDLREDIEMRTKANDGTLTKSEFLEYRDRNKTEDTGGRDDAQSNPCLGPNPPAYCFIGGNAPKEEEEEEPFKMALAFRADGGRVPYADGGIMDLARQELFLGGIAKSIGKAVKGATRAVTKVAKSPFGKMALGAALLGGAGGFSGIGNILGGLKGKGIGSLFGGLKNMSFGKSLALSLGGGALAGLLQKGQYEDEDGDGFDDKTGLNIEELRESYTRPIAFRKEGGMSDIESDPQYKGWKRIYEVNPDAAEMHPKHKEFVKYYANVERQGKEEGGLMDLKGMEMDFRKEGGFVPIGKKERADDVPARLSKNEFVMTADAVRGMGDGNIDKGAEKMYNLMDNLEAENDQSQGLDGARKMFQTSQRLEEVL